MLNRTNASAFQQHLEREYGLFHRYGHLGKGFFVRLGIGLAAIAATEPAKAIAMLAKAGASGIAIRAVHGYFRFGFRLHDSMWPVSAESNLRNMGGG